MLLIWSQTNVFHCIRVWETIWPFGTNGGHIVVQIWDGTLAVSTNHKTQSIILHAAVHFICKIKKIKFEIMILQPE